MGDLQEAEQHLAQLEEQSLRNDQPWIEACAISLDCNQDFDSNFVDRGGFVSGIAKYVEEANSLEKLNATLDAGDMFSQRLYTWRSCSRAIPQVQSNEQSNRVEMYKTMVKVLSPETDKLKELWKFQEDAVKRFCSEIEKLAHPEVLKGFISQTTKLTLGKMLDMFAVLNALKNMKASLSNDFAFFKRAQGFLSSQGTEDMNPAALAETQSVGVFLASQNSITLLLQSELQKIDNYEQVLAEIVNECATLYEGGFYVLPEDKHMLVKVMAYGLFLMDSKDPKKTLMKSKHVDLKRFDKIFKELPVVPLFGDMRFDVMKDFIAQTASYDEKAWTAGSSKEESRAESSEYNVVAKLNGFKTERDQLICALRLADGTDAEGSPCNISGERMYDLALRGVKMLSKWTATIQELYAWKLAHPADRYKNMECTDDKEDYEKAAKYNYTNQEKTALIELIAMIKDVSRILWQMKIPLGDAVRRDMHRDVQEFVQVTIRDALRHAAKKKKKQVQQVLIGCRKTCADWRDSQEPTDDPALTGGKDSNYIPKSLPEPRPVGPGTTQLFMLRTMLESVCADHKKKSLTSDMESKHLPAMLQFYHRSFYFQALLNFSKTLQRASDLSQLWYREYYLELTHVSKNPRIQFPISMSLPFILVDHILVSKDPSMIEFVLYPLDLYNDAANYALTRFQKQFLYDEVEAEVDLAFDQFIFRLTEQIFSHYKSRASSIMLTSKFRSECKANDIPVDELGEHRYSTILKQRSFQLLGRSVDISRLLTQRLNESFERSLKYAIERFEAQDLGHILELESLIENNRIAHALLSEHLDLDSFEHTLAVANNNVEHSEVSRIMLHVFDELCSDVIPNFTFNGATQRFVRPDSKTVMEFGDGQPKRDKLPNAKSMYLFGTKSMNAIFAAINKRWAGFIGRPHFDCMARLLGYGSLAFCVDEMLKTVTTAIKETLSPYVQSLLDGMPKACKLPLFDYGSAGAMGFYQLSLKEIMQYTDLQTEVFHAFREIGNGVIVFLLLEQSISREEIIDLGQSMPYRGIIPVVKGENKKEDASSKSRQMEYIRLGNVIKAIKEPEIAHIGEQAEVLTRERMCKGLSMFTKVLDRIKKALEEADEEAQRKVFGAPQPANGVMDVEECNQFHRLWSVVLYTSCSTAARMSGKNRGGLDIDQHRQWFGDGMQWAGCVIMALMGQRHRFEAFDFTYHIIKAWDMDQKEASHQGVSVSEFVRIGKGKRALNQEIFAILDKYLQFPLFAPQVVYYAPPSVEKDVETSV
eukprot:m.57505 g.57505  ORF g.57505 m.57505 type:complete len:1269 (-) comp11113_c1_seq1:133-3939(-)